MQLKDRVILKQGSTFRDLSGKLSNYLSGSETINMGTSDALYIGSSLPFNHRHFEVSSPNAGTSSMKIQIWGGAVWNDVAEIVDMTNISGVALAQSAVVIFVPDKYKAGWNYAEQTGLISDLAAGPVIYDLYWAKITFTGALTGTTALKYVGHKFSTDEDLFNEYPEFNDAALMSAVKAGKTDWKDQEFAAAEYIIQDLKKAQFIRSKNQLLDYDLFRLASIHKTAQIIYGMRGKNYKEQCDAALISYKRAIAVSEYTIDQNMTAIITQDEEFPTTGWLTR